MTYKEINNNAIQSFEYETTILSDGDIIGACELGKATIQLLNDSNQYSLLKDSWIKTIHGSFYIYEVEPVQEKVSIKLNCYDIKYKLDTLYDSSKHTFPCTLKAWRNSIFSSCNVIYDDSDFPNSDLVLQEEPYIENGASNRTVIKMIAQAGASTVITDKNDKFYFSWFEDKVHIVNDWIELTTEKESTLPINLVVLGRGSTEDNVYYPETKPSNPIEFRIDNNYILDPQDTSSSEDLRYVTIIPIYNRVKDFAYLIFNLRSQQIDQKLSIKLGEKIKFIDIWGNELIAPIMSKKISWLGGNLENDDNYEITLSADKISESSTDLKYASNIKNDILLVERKTDKNSGEIKDIVSIQNSQSTKISQLEIKSNSIETSVSETKESIKQVDSKIDNLQVGGRNLCIESKYVNGYLSADDTIGPMNVIALEKTTDYIRITPDDNVIIQYWVTLSDATWIPWHAYRFYDSEKSPIGSRYVNGYSHTGENSHITYELDIPAEASYIRLSMRTYKDGKMKLEKGNKPTDWTPAPEDIDSNIDNTIMNVESTLNNKIDNIQVGGRNYILNSNIFTNAGVANSTSNTIHPSIENGLWKIVVDSTTNSNWHQWIHDNKIEENLKNDDDFTFSFEIKSSDAINTTPPKIYFKSGMGYYPTIGNVTSEWSKCYYTGKWKNANDIGFHFGWNGLQGTYYIRKLKLENGNMVTDWTPAPEDIDSDINDVKSALNSEVENLQSQIDGAIQFWNGTEIPTVSNYPANEWTTEALKNNHRADIYTVIINNEQGKSYRFDKVGTEWKWVEITDNELSAVKALVDKAQETADGKMKVFSITPTVPYQIGDIWWRDGEIYKCITTKTSGSFSEDDWVSSNYANIDDVTILEDVSGQELTLTNSAGKDLLKYHLDGNSYQETTTGKNLLNSNSINSKGSSVINNGITYNFNEDGSISLNGTATSSSYIMLISNLAFSGRYTISSGIGINSNVYLKVLNAETSYSAPLRTDISGYLTNDISSNKLQVYLYVTEGTNADGVIIKPMIRLASITDDTYEPYTGGQPSPSPDYPQNIEVIRGYNLFDGEIELGNINPADGTLSDNNARTRSKNFIKVKPNTTYSFKRTTGQNRWIVGYTKEKVGITDGNASGQTSALRQMTLNVLITQFTTSPTTQYIKWYDTSCTDLTEEVQIAEGTKNTYLPYQHIGLQSVGKNELVFPYKQQNEITFRGITYTPQEDGSVLINGTATDTSWVTLSDQYFNERYLNSSKTYKFTTLDKDCAKVDGINPQYYSSKNGTRVGKNGSLIMQYNEDETSGWNFVIRVNKDITVSNVRIYPMIRLASIVDDTYEPYKSKLSLINLGENELCNIKDENGNVIVKNELDVQNGQANITKRVGKMVLDGSDDETWKIDGTLTNTIRFKIPISYFTNCLGQSYSNSNYFRFLVNYNSDTPHYYIGNVNGNCYFFMPKTLVSTLAEFKTWLSVNKPEVYYELATPETIVINDVSIQTLEDYSKTNLLATMQSSMSGTYVKNSKFNDVYQQREDMKYYYTKEQTDANIRVESDRITNKVSSIETTMYNDYYKKDQIDASMKTNTENIATLKEQVTTLQQLSNQFSISISNINQNGVTRIVTETGYVFDKDGLHISKTGEETLSLIDNTGLFVKRNNEEVLGADTNGVRTENLTVRTFFIKAAITREEKFDDDILGIGIAEFSIE